MSDIQKLQDAFEQAEARAIKLQNEKDEALDKVRDRFRSRQQAAVQQAADAQKAWLDAAASEALRGRDDAEAVANALGLELPSS
jgi:hypothetical protein